jgi:hypothetical protein
VHVFPLNDGGDNINWNEFRGCDILPRMIVPEFWAEHCIRKRFRNRQITIRRFGWSDESEEAACAHAKHRAEEAFDRAASGATLLRREPRVAYNGAEGVPIREEIVQRHGDTVVTRNGYGALCLNTPSVLFADVDQHQSTTFRGCLLVTLISVIAAGAAAALQADLRRAFGAAALALIVVPIVFVAFQNLRIRLAGGRQQFVRRQIEKAVAQFPAWRMRLYETPAGYRILVTHSTFAPGSEEVEQFFRALRTDPVYARMCRRQKCFRARISPKPWRIGMDSHIRPRRGAWPVRVEHMPARQQWLEDYHRKSDDFASCRFETEFGTAPEHDTAAAVRTLHDDYCRALSGLPIA